MTILHAKSVSTFFFYFLLLIVASQVVIMAISITLIIIDQHKYI